MARVLTVVNDVKKQDGGKLLWKPVRKGDLLYLGEKLKTSTLSNSKIEFLENGATIDVEQETLIIVNKNQKNLSLQVVEGSLFVVSNKNLPELSVTTGNKDENAVNVKDGEFSYSVSKDGKANVEILKGSADPKNTTTTQIVNKFKDMKPGYGESVFIDNKSEDGTVFQWTPLTKEYDISLELGENRNNLQKQDNLQIDLENGLIKIKPMIGTFYWRLMAQNKENQDDKFASNTLKVTFKQKVAPTPIYPVSNDLVQLKKKGDSLEFKWSLFHNYESIVLEVFKENDPTPIVSEQVTTQTFFNTDKINTPGNYSWKLTGKVPNSQSPLKSTTQSFKVYIGDDLQSPIALTPEDRSVIYSQNKSTSSAKNVTLAWKNVKEAVQYLVTIRNHANQAREFKVPVEEFTIPSLASGNYTWSVQSINAQNELSKSISWKAFSINPIGDLKFKEMDKQIYFSGNFPIYKISWDKFSDNALYRLKISQSQSMNPNELIRINSDSFNYQIGKEGLYFIQVEAVNSQELPIATSEVFSFSVTRPPQPPVPAFAKLKSPEASLEGDITFELSNYSKKYNVILEIKDARGATIEQTSSNAAQYSFKALPPGSFYLVARYKDEFNQSSDLSEKYNFTVPNKSMIAAPKLKGVKVR